MTTQAHSAASVDEVRALIQQWRAVMAAGRPHWTGVDLTFTQLRALSTIARRGPMRVGGLAEQLGIGLAAASALADRMHQSRLIARRPDPNDRRGVLLEIGPRGRHLLERLERGSTEHLGKLIGRMTPPERVALATTLRAFARLATEYDVQKQASGLVTVRRPTSC